jgi:transcriptional regulator with AAA-type ATPase domain
MSATEIIAEIQKLPVSEQERVLKFLQDERAQTSPDQGGVRYANDADFDKSAEKILREHADLFRRLAQ